VPFTVSGTATEGTNYRIATPSPVRIPAGTKTADIDIILIDDRRQEDAKKIVVSLGEHRNAASGGRLVHTVTVLDADAPSRIAIMPFTNESSRKFANEIMALHFIRELAKGEPFTVVEPGLIKEKLLDYRIIMYDGISLSDAGLIARELSADLILTGRVLDYREHSGRSGNPKVGFSFLLISTKTQKVVWSASSRNEGDDAVLLFDWGRVNTVQKLASEMVGAIRRTILH
jgi:TolB-like protein